MDILSNAELALLGLIIEQPRHAYEIEQVIEDRVMRSWTEIGFSSIYRILNKLEKSGLLSGKMQPPEGRGPARKVYHPTPAGNAAWQQAALHSLAHPERKYSNFLLGLDSLTALPPEEAQLAVKENLANQEFVYQQLTLGIENHPMKDDFFIKNFFDYMLSNLAAEINWLKEFSVRLENHYRGVGK